MIEAQSSKHGFIEHCKVQGSFLKYFQTVMNSKASGSRSNYSIWCAAFKHLKNYHGAGELAFERSIETDPFASVIA